MNGKDSAYYVILCAVLARRPDLLEATRPQLGSNLGNFLPRSGCRWGRGSLPGFPEAVVVAFENAAEAPTHNWRTDFVSSMRYLFYSFQNLVTETLRLDPRRLLAEAPTRMAAPPYFI